MIQLLKEQFGRKCSGLKLNAPLNSVVNKPVGQFRFCEALNYSFKVPLLIQEGDISCPGAKRSFGHYKDNELLSVRIHENTGIPCDFIRKALKKIPVMNVSVHTILMGITEEMEQQVEPDLYIIYTYPGKIMRIIYECTRIFNRQPYIASNSLLSICGNIFTRNICMHDICISFGCPDSREYGGLDKNEAIVGIPVEFIKDMFPG